MPPDRFLIDKVVDVLRACGWNASDEQRAVAAIEAVFNHERCAVCHEGMVGPTICDVCVMEKTPLLTVDRRHA